MNIDFHLVRNWVAANTLQVSFCSRKDQLADVFTKPIVVDKLVSLRSSLTVLDTPMDSRGSNIP